MQNRGGLTAIVLAVAAFGVSASSAAPKVAPGAAAGIVTIDGVAVRLNHAYALMQPNAFDEAVMDTAVLLTEKPVPPESLKVADLERTIHDITNCAYFVIDAKGKPRKEMIRTATLGEKIPMMTGFTNASFTPVTVSGERIEGKFATKTVETLVGHKYEIAVDFNARIVKSPKAR